MFKYIYFNHMNLAQQTTVHLDLQKRAGINIPQEIMRLLGDINADLTRSNHDGETIVKTTSDFWVVGKKSDSREFYVVINQKNANLIEINGATIFEKKIMSCSDDSFDKIDVMECIGNAKAKEKFEMCVPPFYRRPKKNDVEVLKKEWIMAKYQREEFTDPDRQTAYNCSYKEGMLWKLGRDRKQVQQRKFVLSRADNKFSYFITEEAKQHKQQPPKAEADLDNMNAVFVPEKIGNPYGLQITFIKSGSTRSLFVYSDNSKLAEDLTKDFLLEGWLSKMGPKNEPFRRRWFTLDRRKLMYFEEPLNAFAKGEVFIGHRDAGYHLTLGPPEGDRSSNSQNNFCFTLHTPDRNFMLRAETQDDMDKWTTALNNVIDLPLTPQDSKLASMLVPKKSSNSFRLIKR
nr:hypothetical protein BaRGS_022234 [Batillaria attramentaria]